MHFLGQDEIFMKNAHKINLCNNDIDERYNNSNSNDREEVEIVHSRLGHLDEND